jgi:uncharacterized protein (TIGR02598 family)
MKPAPFTLSQRPSGFTLAEVMIALGIVASVMIGMLAAMPHALKSIRESNSLTIMGRISQEVISDIQMSEWDDIEKNYQGKSFHYDNEGLSYEGREGQKKVYEARVQVKPERASLGNNLEYTTDHMRKVEVKVEFLNNGDYYKDEKLRLKNTQQYNFVVANQNKIRVR